jgi:hypothetical protein
LEPIPSPTPGTASATSGDQWDLADKGYLTLKAAPIDEKKEFELYELPANSVVELVVSERPDNNIADLRLRHDGVSGAKTVHAHIGALHVFANRSGSPQKIFATVFELAKGKQHQGITWHYQTFHLPNGIFPPEYGTVNDRWKNAVARHKGSDDWLGLFEHEKPSTNPRKIRRKGDKILVFDFPTDGMYKVIEPQHQFLYDMRIIEISGIEKMEFYDTMPGGGSPKIDPPIGTFHSTAPVDRLTCEGGRTAHGLMKVDVKVNGIAGGKALIRLRHYDPTQ